MDIEPNNETLRIRPVTTAGVRPELFSDGLEIAKNKTVVFWVVGILVLIAFGFRVGGLGTESLGEDELNKLQTVAEYRENGLSGKNGEHPFLMKGLQTVSITVAEKINTAASPQINISEEAALRFPVALFGAFTALLIFLLVSELFGRSIGLVSAALWAVEPMAIGFDRIAKEDSLVLFFFLLTNLFWIRSQTAAERGRSNWVWQAWAAAGGFAALMASKYYPHLLAILGAYYNVFKFVPGKKWNMEAKRWLIFFAVMGLSFLVLNPTIVLPDTWREMLKFSSENRIGHDSYEFMGSLYTNKMSAWLAGVPWTFYYVFIAVKHSLAVLIFAALGLPMLVRRKMGDGRYFLFFWAFMWFLPFTFLGGKFTRYFTFVEPLLLIAAATGMYYTASLLARPFGQLRQRYILQVICLVLILIFPIWNSVNAGPHYRLFTNSIGGGTAAAGSYFPHDEFYDAATRETIAQIISDGRTTVKVACETPALFEYYAKKAGRPDIVFLSLSDKHKVVALGIGDYVIVTAGRRYFSNSAYIDYLDRYSANPTIVNIFDAHAAKIYKLDETTIIGINSIARQ